ncbi:hypothetical protein ILP97_01800 [Amycolatopsis sp. H6(2020)]|nr:hypothetical protein [Amycolatopsis sp. H6(2020)]
MGRRKTRKVAKSEIYSGIAAVALLWIASFQISIFFPITAVASGALAVFTLCTMPTSCSAKGTETDKCRNNASGVFSACGQINAHVAAKRSLVRTRAYWVGLATRQYSAPDGATAVYIAILGVLSGFVALIFTLVQ